MGLLRGAWLVARKDLRIELRTKEITTTTTFFAAIVASGAKSLLCSRPDGEANDQPTFAEIEAVAREAGLEPLADALWQDPAQEPATVAAAYLDADAGIASADDALDGARQILMERWSEDADLVARLRAFLVDNALLRSAAAPGAADDAEAAKFRDYFEHCEPLAGVPSHRALAMFRGRNAGFLQLALVMDPEEKPGDAHPCEAMLADHWAVADQGRPADGWLGTTLRWTWRVKLLTRLQTDLLGDLRERAETEAIAVFARNLKDLLLAAPAGPRPTMGLDPGLRTGVKVAVVDGTGKLLDHATIFPNAPQKREAEAAAKIAGLAAPAK